MQIVGTAYKFTITADGGYAQSSPSPQASASTPSDPWATAATGSSTVSENGTYSLALSSSTSTGSPAFGCWEINWGDGSSPDTIYTATTTATHTFAAGTDLANVTVTANTATGAADPLIVTTSPR